MDEPEQEATLFPATVGEKLRGSREAQGVDLADIAARTRIPQRHLEAIEKSNYSSLPSITYSVGFAKAYARAVGLDEVAIARELRAELGDLPDRPERAAPMPSYDMDDPTRAAPAGLVWIGLVVALLVLAGVGIWYGTDWFRGSAPPPETIEIPQESPTPADTPAPLAGEGGQVTLIALDTVWLRVEDGTGRRLFEKEMAPGERYDVPMDADHPRVQTGRADQIQVTINGSNVAPLGPGEQTVNVEVSADALRARPAPGATGTAPTLVPPPGPLASPPSNGATAP